MEVLDIKEEEDDPDPVACSKCNRVFAKGEDLQTHFSEYHQEDHVFDGDIKVYYNNCSETPYPYSKRQQEYQGVLELIPLTDETVGINVGDRRVAKAPRNVQCNLCDFINCKSKVMIHVRGVHEKRRVFHCHLCVSVFTQQGNLTRHVKNIHKQLTDYVRCT